MIAKTPGTIIVERIEENTTGRVGLHWIYESMRHWGLERKISYRFRRKKSNRARSAWDKISASVLMILAGGSCPEDIEYMRKDQGLLTSLGLVGFVGSDTLLRFIGRKGNVIQLKKCVQDAAIKALSAYQGTTLTYDNDATYFNSQKNCAEYSYQKEKQMSALLGYIAELNGICITSQYRPGNVSPAKGILDELKEAYRLCQKAGQRLTRFRSDSAAHTLDIFQYCEKHTIHFFVTLDKNPVTNKEVRGIAESEWQDLKDQPGKHWAEFTHCMARGKKNKIAMRALALRWPNPDPTLFDTSPYCYHIIATNDWHIEPMDWLKVHNGRMNAENYHKELKSSLAATYMPSHSLIKNEGFFLLNLLSYNVLVIFKSFYLDAKQHTWTIKTLRYRFIHTCARFVQHARKTICKLINVTDETFHLFQRCAARLCLSP